MIIVKIMGGLGNQMFQYALGRALSEKYHSELLLDTDYYKHQDKRVYALNKFAISATVATPAEISGNKRVVEKDMLFDPDILGVGPDAYLDGYWQSEKYFKAIEPTLRAEFVTKEKQGESFKSMLAHIKLSAATSLHVRRGDYLDPKHQKIYKQLPLSYYERAVAFIAEKVGDIKVFIFSDDIDWVKRNLSLPFPIEYVSAAGFADYQELILMAACKHNIIANSSFSWWGAWLNENRNKILIAPKKWFVDMNRDERDLIPATWIKL
jgi:hypothetical protein